MDFTGEYRELRLRRSRPEAQSQDVWNEVKQNYQRLQEMSALDKYATKRVLAIFYGPDAWKKLVPIRWPQVQVRAGVRRRFKNADMSNALLVIFVTPKTGQPTHIEAHFYPDQARFEKSIENETEDLWITDAPYAALELEGAPKLLKKLTKDLD